MNEGNLFGQFNHDKEEEKKNTRRRFLAAAGGVLATGAAITGISEVVKSESDKDISIIKEAEKDVIDVEGSQAKKINDPTIYKNGERINSPIGSIKIDKWKIKIDELDILQWLALTGLDAKSFMLKAKNSEGFSVGEFYYFSNSHKDHPTLPPTGVLMDPNPEKGEFGKSYSFYALPSSESSIVILELTIFEDKAKNFKSLLDQEVKESEEDIKLNRMYQKALEAQEKSSVLHPIDFVRSKILAAEYFEARENYLKKKKIQERVGKNNITNVASEIHTFKVDLNSFVPSETKLKPRVLSEVNIGQEYLSKLNELHGLFSDIRPIHPIMVIDQELGKNKNKPFFDSDDDYRSIIMVESQDFTNSPYDNFGEIVAVHELTHGLVHFSDLKGETYDLWNSLIESHKELKTKINYPRGSLVFRIFTESSYLKNKFTGNFDDKAGHPWDNTNEFMASFVTTMRYFTDEFITKFKKLSEEDKTNARNLKNKAIAFLKSMDKSKDLQLIKKLIPRIEEIQKL
jgi:hypothetical protein